MLLRYTRPEVFGVVVVGLELFKDTALFFGREVRTEWRLPLTATCDVLRDCDWLCCGTNRLRKATRRAWH